MPGRIPFFYYFPSLVKETLLHSKAPESLGGGTELRAHRMLSSRKEKKRKRKKRLKVEFKQAVRSAEEDPRR